MSFTKKYFILLMGTGDKRCILQNWKSEFPPSQRQWLNELTSYSTPEKIFFSVRRNPEKYKKIWGSFLALSHQTSPESKADDASTYVLCLLG